MSVRSWVSVVTVVFLVLIVYGARHEISHAWDLLDTVNLGILSLLVPFQILSYLMSGEMMFSYLRAKKVIRDVPAVDQARMALEMNFVNHILPSAGVSGLSYMTWRMHQYGISAGRATLAQLIRYVMSFAAFATLLFLSLVVITMDGHINRWIIFVSALMIVAMLVATFGGAYLIAKPSRYQKFSQWITKTLNGVWKFLTLGRKKKLVEAAAVEEFFTDIHEDYLTVRAEKKLLRAPYLWSIAFTIFEVLLFMSTFWALGANVNPAAILIAFGLAAGASTFVATPGGAGAYEVVMASFLVATGVPQGLAIAGTVLTRVILLLGTILFGYVFYQDALVRYGKPATTTKR